jgi:hypothetical protein
MPTPRRRRLDAPLHEALPFTIWRLPAILLFMGIILHLFVQKKKKNVSKIFSRFIIRWQTQTFDVLRAIWSLPPNFLGTVHFRFLSNFSPWNAEASVIIKNEISIAQSVKFSLKRSIWFKRERVKVLGVICYTSSIPNFKRCWCEFTSNPFNRRNRIWIFIFLVRPHLDSNIFLECYIG